MRKLNFVSFARVNTESAGHVYGSALIRPCRRLRSTIFFGYFRNSLSDGCWTRTAISLLTHRMDALNVRLIFYLILFLIWMRSTINDEVRKVINAHRVKKSIIFFDYTLIPSFNSRPSIETLPPNIHHRNGLKSAAFWTWNGETIVSSAQVSHIWMFYHVCLLSAIRSNMSSYTV